jgi:hypothetical protein
MRRDAQNNQFSGALPTEMGGLSHLKILDFTDNRLTGFLPTQLGKLSMLSVLHMYRNEFIGPLPTEFGMLSLLTGLCVLPAALPLVYLVRLCCWCWTTSRPSPAHGLISHD